MSVPLAGHVPHRFQFMHESLRRQFRAPLDRPAFAMEVGVMFRHGLEAQFSIVRQGQAPDLTLKFLEPAFGQLSILGFQ